MAGFYDFFFTPSYELPKKPWPYGKRDAVYIPAYPVGRYLTRQDWEAMKPERITGFKKWLMGLGEEKRVVATPIKKREGD